MSSGRPVRRQRFLLQLLLCVSVRADTSQVLTRTVSWVTLQDRPRPEASGWASPALSMAVSIFLANSPPLHSFLGGYDSPLAKRVEPLRPCLSNVRLLTRNPTASAEILSRPTWKKRKEKRVAFADSRGLALTVVHVFNEAEDNLLSELQFHMAELEGATSDLRLVPSQGEPSQRSERSVCQPCGFSLSPCGCCRCRGWWSSPAPGLRPAGCRLPGHEEPAQVPAGLPGDLLHSGPHALRHCPGPKCVF